MSPTSSPLTAAAAPSISGMAHAFPVPIAIPLAMSAIVSTGLSIMASTVSPTKVATGTIISSKANSVISEAAPATQSTTSVT